MSSNNNDASVKRLLGNTHPAVIAVWAALITVGNILPSLPMIGTGGTFSISAIFIPLAGVFFGPVGGAICAAIGGFIGQIVAPHTAWLGIGTFLIATTNAFVTGLVSRKKWIWAILIILLGTILWFTTATGRQVPLFPMVFYTMGVIAALLGGIFADKWFKNEKAWFKGIGIFLAAFAGFVSAAALANYAGLIMLQFPAEIFKVLVFLAPWERTVFSLGAAIIGIPLLVGLPKIGVFVGPYADEEEDETIDTDQNKLNL